MQKRKSEKKWDNLQLFSWDGGAKKKTKKTAVKTKEAKKPQPEPGEKSNNFFFLISFRERTSCSKRQKKRLYFVGVFLGLC